ncbi:MAG TPA: 50S ribosomal protein L23 [Spirochaetia bacterium]|nr:50S ribosomal protein L23 [Spirochaetales bacterium]HRS66184.1 50S ribosomal protein L23 [Spirochaetia bacterium]HOT59049.1 50S ribosomal protein L23 [Spirochaetales bacterium]HPD81192.1 50S ribosomal protein L23 [Spirochaetales bacterium]HQK35757.1 50S ribosomal protein L23 [Spirochaetales bacterium]
MENNEIIIEPVLTEKSNAMREAGQYVFRVDARATKIQVKKAVAALFNVHPVSCNMINVKSKPKRLRGRPGRTSSWKKAVVRLAPGESISVFEGV